MKNMFPSLIFPLLIVPQFFAKDYITAMALLKKQVIFLPSVEDMHRIPWRPKISFIKNEALH